MKNYKITMNIKADPDSKYFKELKRDIETEKVMEEASRKGEVEIIKVIIEEE